MKFLETVRDTYLYQRVREATRYRSDNQHSLLDLVFTNEEGIIESMVHNSPIGNSDHEVLEFKFQFGTNVNKTPIQQRLLFFKGNYEAINKKLTDIEWLQETSKTFGIVLPIDYQIITKNPYQ
jgi:hypothetical protein